MIGLVIDYSGCRPPSSHVQDVDGDGFVANNDVIWLKSWVIGLFDNPTGVGVPFEITLLTPETLPVLNAGDTVPISAWTFDNPAHGPVTPRTGWGMIFEIDPASSCPNGELDGRNPYPQITEPRDSFTTSTVVFEYTSEMDALPQGGAAEVLARYTGGCAPGTTIEVIVRIPDDNEAIPPGQGHIGRFRQPEVPFAPIQAAETIKIPVGGGLEVISISINQPDPIDLSEGDTVRITAICTYDDLSTDDCSEAGGLICSVTGDLGESGCLVTALQIDHCDGAGTVTAEPVTNPNSASDLNNVNVLNNESVTSISVTPENPPALRDGDSAQFTCTALWSDSTYTDCTPFADWYVDLTPGCGSVSQGSYTAWFNWLEEHFNWCTDFVNADFCGRSDYAEQPVLNPTMASVFSFDPSSSEMRVYYDWTSSVFNDWEMSGGHTVGIAVGDTSLPACAGSGDDAQCWINITNRDSQYYMANFMAGGNNCTWPLFCGPSFETLDNADAWQGDTTGVCTGEASAEAGCGGPVGLVGGDICYVEDGQYVTQPSPYNEKGCKIYETASSGLKPYQILHPDCGQISNLWDFGNITGPFDFSIGISAEWYPWNPTGDGLPGTTVDNDPRYDFANRSTYYIMVTDLNNNSETGPYQWGGTANGRAWINIGSHIRSNVLSGWAATGSGKAELAERRYFGVSVAVEYADRIESQVMGNQMLNLDYEYYADYGYIMRYNTSVVTEVAAANLTNISAGTKVVRGARFHCTSDQLSAPNAPCDGAWQAYEGLGELAFGTVSDYRGVGWIALNRGLASNFEYFPNFASIQKFDGGVLTLSGGIPATTSMWASPQAYMINPRAAGHHGVAHFDWALATVTYNNSAAIIQEGPDAAPEMPLAVYYFQVRPGTSGFGSEFWMDMMSTGTYFRLNYTNGTIYPSGTQAGTDDWLAFCSPIQPGFENPVDQGCDPGQPQSFYDVYASLENVNTDISHSGPSVWGGDATGGAVQQWPAHVCVQ
jgi:hypothetical protein